MAQNPMTRDMVVVTSSRKSFLMSVYPRVRMVRLVGSVVGDEVFVQPQNPRARPIL